ncbi:sensor histidine kinase [Anaerorhabdus sp.]|uniref:sensor histidine kinase n=1 Tax=Anaerorhabdus sp. TaxID=1872524 RepID=UPI002FC81AAA
MKKKIFQSIAITSIIFVTIAYLLCAFFFYNDISKNIRLTLKTETNALAKYYNEDPSVFLETKFYSDSRITLINADGNVLYDSQYDSNSLINHSNRPEFVDAVNFGSAERTRYSDTLNETTYYYALRLNDGSVLRLSTIANSALTIMIPSIVPIMFILIIVFIVCLIVARFLTRKIIDPINHLNLDIPLANDTYPELKPLLENLNYHNKIRKEFSANVSHELKTPLTSISGYAEIMANNLQGDNTQEFSQKIVDESKHLLRTIEDIIKLSKLDEGTVQLDYDQINYQEVLHQVLRSLSDYANLNGITLVDNSVPVTGRAVSQIVYEIFYNLIQNAIKYNTRNGHVWIDMKERGKFVEITIKDDGIGINDIDKERIFERFFRSDKSHSSQIEGTGLGLAIVKHGVEFHHGTIVVDDYLNHGSKFTIKLKR